MPTEAGDLVSLLVEAEDGLLVDVVRGRDHHRLEPVQLKLDSQRSASIQSQLNYHHVVMTGLLVLTSGGSSPGLIIKSIRAWPSELYSLNREAIVI